MSSCEYCYRTYLRPLIGVSKESETVPNEGEQLVKFVGSVMASTAPTSPLTGTVRLDGEVETSDRVGVLGFATLRPPAVLEALFRRGGMLRWVD